MFKRPRPRTLQSLKDRLAAFAQEMRAKASLLRPGIEQETTLPKARQTETTVHLDQWANSPGLQPPK
jgi:hypothetical protein